MNNASAHPLTPRQSQILSLISSHTQTQGHPPTYRELMKLLGLSSPATLHKHIQNLKNQGHLKTLPRGWRTLKAAKTLKNISQKSSITRNEIAIIGAVTKGQKIELYAKATFFDIPQSLRPASSTLYAFHIKDDSFSHVHMLCGDIIVIETRQEPHNTEMILAHSKKYGVQIGRYIVTYADRQLHSFIQEIDKDPNQLLSFEEKDLHIQGVIVGLFRSYQFSESSSASGSKSSKA